MTPKKDEYMRGYSDGFKDGMAHNGETGMVLVTGKERPMLRPEAASTEARFESASLHQVATLSPKPGETGEALDDAKLDALLASIDAIQADGTSENPLGYGPPYKAPWFIIDTSTAEMDVNWPGTLIEEINDPGEVGKALRRAKIAVLRAALSPPKGNAEGVKVKPLVWKECPALGGGKKLVAIDCSGNEFARLDLPMSDTFVAEWKRQKQADYETRILSALTPSPISGEVAEPVAWLHTLHMELGQTERKLSFTKNHPFGWPDIDYDSTYTVTSVPLLATQPTQPEGDGR